MNRYGIPMYEYKREGWLARRKRQRIQGSLIMPRNNFDVITGVLGIALMIAITIMIVGWLVEKV